MKLARSIRSAALWRLRLVAAVLAVAGQIGISGASLTLARNESSSVSHTERSGIDLHRGHDDATCATCAVLAFHANLDHAAPPASARAESCQVAIPRAVDFVSGPQFLSNSCRAPPRES